MSLRGDPRTLRALRKAVRALPVRVAQDVAAAVAPRITAMAAGDYDAGRTVYSEARPAGVAGPLDLVVSGATRARVRFVAIGTMVRAELGTRYARYLIGKYRILPMGDMPVRWQREIGETTRRVIAQAVPS